MATFIIDAENNITALGSQQADFEGEIFASKQELADLAAKWPANRLVEVWNGIPGLTSVKKFTDRKSAVSRIWKAIQNLDGITTEVATTAPEPANEPKAGGKKGKKANSATKAKAARKRAKGGDKPAVARDGSKKAEILGLLQRKGGATLAQIMKATGWQAHSVRGFISGALGKKMRLTVGSERREDGERVYTLVSQLLAVSEPEAPGPTLGAFLACVPPISWKRARLSACLLPLPAGRLSVAAGYNRAVTAVENLQRLGIVVPEPPAAVGAYVTWVRTGNLVLTSGQLPWRNKTMLHPGRLGGEVSVEDGYQAARQAGLNAIAQLKSATGGDLEKIRRIVRLEGYVHCAPGFRDHPKVLDGASDLLLEVFEERGKHVRIALGTPDMPLNACVQLGVWAEVSD